MPRYVILLHQTPPHAARPTHYDLMFEAAGVLRTWAIPAAPSPGQPLDAEQLADHRLAYLTYEGPVSGDRGEVSRWDEGEYIATLATPARLEVVVRGRKLSGTIRLECSEADSSQWSFAYLRVGETLSF